MENQSNAFKEKITEGLVRIFLNIGSITCESENDAPDFVDPIEDKPRLKILPESNLSHLTNVFNKTYPVELDRRKSDEEQLVWKIKEEGVWFDIEMDKVKEVWLSEFDFYLESEKPRYLTYYVRDVEHKVQWLQVSQNGSGISSLSEFKKQFKPPKITGKQKFDGIEVLKCADMLGRAIQKIDLPYKSAMVKFNTEKGRLEPLIIGIAEKLGYTVEPLEKEVILREEENGKNVSHLISMK